MNRDRTVFLSHAQSDADAAKALRDWLVSVFGDSITVFASSDWQSIEAGMDWYETIDRALRDSALGILLLTETSVKRPWVNYELGVLRAGKKKTVPLCVGRVTKSSLQSPFGHSQACDYDTREDRLALLKSISSTFGFPPVHEGAADSAPTLISKPDAPLRPLPVGHGLPIERLFNSSDRWTTVVYTCRATFTGEQCIPGGPIKKALWSHVPVDEVQTVCVAINHLMPAELRAHEDDILYTVICSKRAEESILTPASDRDSSNDIPSLLERDLVIIGENNFSNMLLKMVQCYLPWHAGTGQVVRGRGKLRPDVYVELVPRFNATVLAGQKRELHRGAGMIAFFPNPLNVRKRVLILFGCHREGQFTLENWLRSDEVREIVDGIQKATRGGASAIQVVVDRTLAPTDGIEEAVAAEAMRNLNDGQRFWFTQLNRSTLGDTVVVNASCAEPYDLYDVSLVVPLPPTVHQDLVRLVTEKLPMPDFYWEYEKCEIGFHITLYEFLTYHRPPLALLSQLKQILPQLRDALRKAPENDLPGGTIARIRGIEFLPSAMVSYVEFLDETGKYCAWLNAVRRWCERSAVRSGLTQPSSNGLNAMRVPFPVHITLLRFNREVQETEQDHLRRTAVSTRAHELMRFSLENASLAVATKSPYRNVSLVDTFRL